MDSSHTKLLIGASTGWLYAAGIYSSAVQTNFLKITGVNCLEICLGGWENDNARTTSLEQAPAFDEQIFVYQSLHLPTVSNQEPEQQLLTAKRIVNHCRATVAVTHPLKIKGDYPVEYYEKMISGGIPLAIENMDKGKDSGFNLAELKKLLEIIGCHFVLDAQHAYEHDSEMKYAKDLLELSKDQLAHLHVSGETSSNNHSLIHQATNAKTIIEFIGQVLSIKKVPLILEGEYTSANDLQQEIKFLTTELCS